MRGRSELSGYMCAALCAAWMESSEKEEEKETPQSELRYSTTHRYFRFIHQNVEEYKHMREYNWLHLQSEQTHEIQVERLSFGWSQTTMMLPMRLAVVTQKNPLRE